jgi:glyoxylase-like metal-dependent hydrolase (beta-lactamase superfamily II)
MDQVIPNVFYLKNLVVNQYIIIDKGMITLIDSGLKGFTNKLFRELSSIGLDIMKIRRILITHADGDHYGAVNQIRVKVKPWQ